MTDFDPKAIRKDLNAMRKKYGADSPQGHRCSNIIEQLDVYPQTSGEHRKRLEAEIANQIASLAKLTGGRH